MQGERWKGLTVALASVLLVGLLAGSSAGVSTGAGIPAGRSGTGIGKGAGIPAGRSSTGAAEAGTFYVSTRGNNADGLSWTTAWRELDQIDWARVKPGDTILLDGGAQTMTYRTALLVEASGTSAAPITIRLANEPGRNGRVVIDGGLTYWPCQASGPSPYDNNHPEGTRRYGMDLNGQDWLNIDGTKPGGIEIRNHNQEGVKFGGGSSHIRLAYMHIHHNTYAVDADGVGVDLSGDGHTLERLEINNNGQDAIQGAEVTNLVLQDSYLHNHHCSHPDGIQLFRGTNTNIIIRRNVFHDFLQCVFLGGNTHESSANNVVVAYNVMYNSTYGVVSNYAANHSWSVYNNTIVDIEEIGIHLHRSDRNMNVHNNILYRSKLLNPNGKQSHNLFYGVPNPPTGNGSFEGDPRFSNRGRHDYRLLKGSRAIDAGVNMGQKADMIGTPVPSGPGFDIGAYEYYEGIVYPTFTPTTPRITVTPARPPQGDLHFAYLPHVQNLPAGVPTARRRKRSAAWVRSHPRLRAALMHGSTSFSLGRGIGIGRCARLAEGKVRGYPRSPIDIQ